MDEPLKYPEFPALKPLLERLQEFARLKYEYGVEAGEIERTLAPALAAMQETLAALSALPEDPKRAALEPNGLEEIRALRPKAERKLWMRFDREKYADRLAGAFLGRMAGCTLGAPVEFWTPEAMESWAAYIGDPYPPTDYWSSIKNPNDKRYGVSRCVDYTRAGLDGVPVDDDITYTILGLLIAEDYGLDFSVHDAGKAWVRYLPYACTAEDMALKNLTAGVDALEAVEADNPYVQWIGADIRSDPWGYLAPGQPEKAAGMAYRDAWLSHRRNGIYGEMFVSAAISAAFAVGDPVEALRLGLGEIPADCRVAVDVRWALERGKSVRDHAEARRLVTERFDDMSGVHTNNNLCLTVFGLMIGGDDFTRCIGETVAMGYDNDCTAATVGSLFGAAKGLSAIPPHWHAPFHNKVLTYLHGHPVMAIDDVLARFAALAEKSF
jgi:ADP-ribosylglycohydrolase